MTTPSASSVSAALRRGGLNPLGSGTPRSREGLRVTRGFDYVTVTADLDRSGESFRLSTDAEFVLMEAGYRIERLDTNHLRVVGRDPR